MNTQEISKDIKEPKNFNQLYLTDISRIFYPTSENTCLKSCMEPQRPQTANTHLRKKNKVAVITLPNLKL